MKPMHEVNVSLVEISNLLFDLFVANPHRYARQLPDGNYNTVYKRFTPAKILHSLKNQGSFLTYQEAQGYIKWICLDFDITKRNQHNYYEYFPMLLLAVKETITFLEAQEIDYLLECSGRRGFHIWLIFNSAIEKANGYMIAKHIIDNNKKISEDIAVDLYPKTQTVNKKSKGIGLGVKLPLSLHRKSGKYSFFVKNIDNFNSDREQWPSKLENSFILEQLNILKNYPTQDIKVIRKKLNLQQKEKIPTYIKASLKVETSDLPTLDEILTELKKCNCLKTIVNNYPFDLNEQERKIIVGILCRINSETMPSYGRELLKEFFSRLPNYNPEITDKKIELLSGLYPPTCKSVQETFGACNLNCGNVASPAHFLQQLGISFNKKPTFGNVNEILIKRTVNAKKKYTYLNDEVPFVHTLNSLTNVDINAIICKYSKVLDGSYKINSSAFFSFIRKEGENKNRKLVTLDYESKLLSTIAMYQLNSIWQDCISPNSYAYQVQDSFQGDMVFKDWLLQWHLFIKQVKDIINDEENAFDDYYIHKIDLSNFYDSLDLLTLQIKLLDEPIKVVADRLSEFTKDEKHRYTKLIQYLIDLCKITNPLKGVPQGPAFARYLAEIYLIGFDNMVQNSIVIGHDFYFRYVDDIFIFVKDKERSIRLNDNINQELSLLNLTKNATKSFVLNVKEFRKRELLAKYQDDSKYFIDQIEKQKSIATQSELDKTIELANSMIADSQWGLKDHFRFIFTHFSENHLLEQAKKKIATKIIESTYGRGSLYRIFFDKYYFKEFRKELSIENVCKLNDLALANYLNSLCATDQKIELPANYLVNIAKLKTELPDYVKVALFSVALKYKQPLRAIVKEDNSLLNIILKSNVNNEISDIWFDINFESLFSEITEYSDFVNSLLLYIKSNIYSFNLLRKLAEYFWKRTTENIDNFSAYLTLNRDFDSVYNLLCLLTIVTTVKQQEAFKRVWIVFLNYVSNILDILFTEKWFNNLNLKGIEEISSETWTICVLANKEGGFLQSTIDKYALVNRFRDILFVISTRNSRFFESLNNEAIKNKSISDIIKNDIFLEWIINPQVKLYPNDETCLINISKNGLAVLRYDNDYLIKKLNGILDTFEYVNISKMSADKSVLVIKKDNKYECLDTQINRQKDHFLKLKKLLALKESAQTFINVNGCKFPNYFLKDTFISIVNNFPFIPFYAKCSNLISSKNTIVDNDENGFLTLLLQLLNDQNLKFTSVWDSEGASQLFSDGDNPFFPQHIKSDADKINFLDKFYGYLTNSGIAFIGYRIIHQAWCFALLETLPVDDKINSFFSVYFNSFANKELNQLIYKAADVPNSTNLFIYLESLKNSIELDFVKDGIIELENCIIAALKNNEDIKQNNDYDNLDLKLFENANFEIKREEKTPGNVRYIFENNDLLDPNNNYVFIDLENSTSFDKITKDNISKIINRQSYESFVYKTDNTMFIVFTPRYLKKCKESIVKRGNWLKHDGIDPYNEIRHRLLWNHEENINRVWDNIEKLASHLSNHLDCFDIQKNKARIINWLLLLNEYTLKDSNTFSYMNQNNYKISDLYEILLEVALKHHTFTETDIDNFGIKMGEYLNGNKYLLLPLKRIEDLNGLHTLLTKTNQIRNEKITNCVSKIENKNDTQDTLVILSDIYLTGSQSEKAIEYYWGDKSKKDNMYHEISADFVKKIKTFGHIIFFSLTSTHFFEQRKINCLSENQISAIEHVAFNTLQTFNYDEIRLYQRKKELFEHLIKDTKVIQKIFNIDEYYIDSITKNRILKTNVVLRLKSTTKKGFMLFTADPKMKGVEPLFERKKEHNEGKKQYLPTEKATLEMELS